VDKIEQTLRALIDETVHAQWTVGTAENTVPDKSAAVYATGILEYHPDMDREFEIDTQAKMGTRLTLAFTAGAVRMITSNRVGKETVKTTLYISVT